MSDLEKIQVQGTLYNIADAEARQVVKVSDTEPTEPGNKIWVSPASQEIQIPTYTEFEDLEDDVADLKGAVDSTLIKLNTDEKYTHTGLNLPEQITFIGNSKAFKSAKYANKRNYYPKQNYSETKGNVAYSGDGCFWTLNGTSSQTSSYNASYQDYDPPIPAGTYTMYCEVDVGESTSVASMQFGINIVYSDNTTAQKNTYIKDADKTVSVTFAKDVKRLQAIAGNYSGCVFNNFKAWFGLFDSTVQFVDTNETIAPDGELTVNINNSNLTVIDSCQHESTVLYIADSKTYIDGKVPAGMLTKDDLVYLSPEMYNAKGDGVTDDSAAIAACLSASKVSDTVYIPVRGFGRYKIASSIQITGQNANVYLHHLVYTGSDAAVKVSGSSNVLKFDYIDATNSNTAVGLKIDGTGDSGFSSCDLTCERILSRSHCVSFTSASPNIISYNVLRFGTLRSTYGDIFHSAVNAQCNEIDIYGKYVHALNGHFALAEENTLYPGIRFHQFCLESDLKYGIKGFVASLIECRTDEFMGQKYEAEDSKKGILFDFDGRSAMGCYADALTKVNYDCIDVSGALSYGDIFESVTDNYNALPSGASSDEVFNVLKPLFYNPSVFESLQAIQTGKLWYMPKGKIISFFDKKVIRPECDLIDKPTTAEFTIGLSNPTFIDLEDANNSLVSIYLNDNYCWPGISKFAVKQYSAIKAKVYDKNENLIFDGTAKDAGVYEFECAFEKLSSLTIDVTGGDTYSVPDTYLNVIYTGENEVWHVYKRNEAT